MMASYIVILGDSVSGLTFYGPFPDYETALEWCENEAGGVNWSIDTLTAPES